MVWNISSPVHSDESDSEDEWLLQTPISLDSVDDNNSYMPVINGYHQSTPKRQPNQTKSISLDISDITAASSINKTQSLSYLHSPTTPPTQPQTTIARKTIKTNRTTPTARNNNTVTTHSCAPAIEGHKQPQTTPDTPNKTDRPDPIYLSPAQSPIHPVTSQSLDAIFFMCVPTLWNNS